MTVPLFRRCAEVAVDMAATHLFVVVAAALVAAGGAHCPHQCSGHGICGSDDLCSCYTGFTNYDCSERACGTPSLPLLLCCANMPRPCAAHRRFVPHRAVVVR